MVTNVMLRNAAEEAERALLDAVEAGPFEPHRFSDRFERSMNKLIRKVKHPISYKILYTAVATLSAVFILFGLVFAISPEVRASAINWVKSTFFEFTQYSNTEKSEITEYKYGFQTIPEGYSEYIVNDLHDGRTCIYIREDDWLLKLVYIKGERAHSLFLITDVHTHVEGQVAGDKADIYISNSEKEASAIVWTDSESGYLFYIGANADKEQLIALAESVTKIPTK